MASCSTEVYEFDFQWTIKKFSVQLEYAQTEPIDKLTLKSSTFSGGDDSNKTNWHLELNIHGPQHENKDFIGLFTVSECTDKTQAIWAHQEYFVVDDATIKISFRSTMLYKFRAEAPAWGLNRFYEIAKLMENKNVYVPNDNLTISCHMTVTGPPTSTKIINSPIPTLANHKLTDDYTELFMSGKFSNVTIVLDDDERIPAHKTILMARSPMFASILEDRVHANRNDDEDEEEEITIDEIDPEIFKEILEFIYTDEVADVETNTLDLMCAADEYGLVKLVEMCMEYFHRTITVSNAAEYLMNAERLGSQRLIEYIRGFMSRN